MRFHRSDRPKPYIRISRSKKTFRVLKNSGGPPTPRPPTPNVRWFFGKFKGGDKDIFRVSGVSGLGGGFAGGFSGLSVRLTSLPGGWGAGFGGGRPPFL